MTTKQIATTVFGLWFGIRMSQVLVPSNSNPSQKMEFKIGKKAKAKKSSDIKPEDIPTNE